MSDGSFTLGLDGDVSAFSESVQDEIVVAIATRAGVDPSAVTVTITSGSVILDVDIRVPTPTAAAVLSTMATATNTPRSAAAMLSSVNGLTINVVTITTPAAVTDSVPAAAGLGGGAIFGIILLVLILCTCIVVGVLWKLKKLPPKLQSKLTNQVTPAPLVADASVSKPA